MIHTVEKAFVCVYCDKTFKNYYSEVSELVGLFILQKITRQTWELAKRM